MVFNITIQEARAILRRTASRLYDIPEDSIQISFIDLPERGAVKETKKQENKSDNPSQWDGLWKTDRGQVVRVRNGSVSTILDTVSNKLVKVDNDCRVSETGYSADYGWLMDNVTNSDSWLFKGEEK